jgi:Replication protein C N-terminal domain
MTPVDSPTGRRWGHRDAKTGKIVEAYGFDLSPIALRHAEFVAVAERVSVPDEFSLNVPIENSLIGV